MLILVFVKKQVAVFRDKNFVLHIMMGVKNIPVLSQLSTVISVTITQDKWLITNFIKTSTILY